MSRETNVVAQDDAYASEKAPALPFPVVGIGASAGGLQALEKLFRDLPESPRAAFVVITHLDPDYHSRLAEILAKSTTMKVQQARQGMRLEPDNVYVIPPAGRLTLKNGSLRLWERSRQDINTIDVFLESLAKDQGNNAFCVILSGMGSDGTRGVSAVKEAGGIVIVQNVDTAEYSDMPRSVIGTGHVDLVLPLADIPLHLYQHIKAAANLDGEGESPPLEEDGEILLRRVLGILRAESGHDFSTYKASTIGRRIRKRMLLTGVEDLPAYVRRLESEPAERRILFHDLFIRVTRFFRDQAAFDTLRAQVLPILFKGRKEGDSVRVWVAGCSTGEEAYSLAILLSEYMEEAQIKCRVKIFASDIDKASVEAARRGAYPGSIADDVPQALLQKYFSHTGTGYAAQTRLREMIVFTQHDILRDPPFFMLDLVVCRNLFIYLTMDAQAKVLALFNYSLNREGVLFLGPAETLGEQTSLFEPLDRKWRIFRKIEAFNRQVRFPVIPGHKSAPAPNLNFSPERRGGKIDAARLLERELADRYGKPSLLVDGEMNILRIHGDVSRYMDIPQGEITSNVYKFIKKSLRLQLRSAIARVMEMRQAVVLSNLRMVADDPSPFSLVVTPVGRADESQSFLLVVFESMEEQEPIKLECLLDVLTENEVVTKLEDELKDSREQLREMMYSYDAVNEELKASNEELMSMNEELQSSYEELESGKEELQSLNEELTIVNSELQRKVEELDSSNCYLEHLFKSTDVATVFLDRELRILRSTPAASRIFHIRDTDGGRPITDFSTTVADLAIPQLAARVAKSRKAVEHEVLARDGHWYLVRMLPYQTPKRELGGVVFTLVDISQLKEAEDELKKANEELERRVEERTSELRAAREEAVGRARELDVELHSIAEGLVFYDLSGRIVRMNEYARNILGHTDEEAALDLRTRAGHFTLELPDGMPVAFEDLPVRRALGGEVVQEFIVRYARRDSQTGVWLSINAAPIPDTDGRPRGAVAAMRDITSIKSLEHDLARAKEEAERANRAKSEFLANMSHEIRTPMNGVLGMTELALMEDLPLAAHQHLQFVKQSGKALLEIINDILDLSKIESGTITLESKPFRLRESVEGALGALSMSARDKGLSFRYSVDPDLPDKLLGDQGRLRQILTNLVGNGIKFTEKGAVRVSVTKAQEPASPGAIRLFFEVNDDGIGIPSEWLAEVFQPFSQIGLSSHAIYGGTGLGLSISRELVEMMGGRIWAGSEVGKGSTFYFTAEFGLSETRSLTAQSSEQPQPSEPVRSLRILIAEDNLVNRLFVAGFLKKRNHSVETAENGREALEKIKAEKFDLVLMDVRMPEMGGQEAVRALRQGEAGAGKKDTLVVALTAHAVKGDREKFLAAGMDDYLAKPIDLDELDRILERAALHKEKE